MYTACSDSRLIHSKEFRPVASTRNTLCIGIENETNNIFTRKHQKF